MQLSGATQKWWCDMKVMTELEYYTRPKENAPLSDGAHTSATDKVDTKPESQEQGHHAVEVSNESFLQAIFGDDYTMAHVTAFTESPDTIDPNDPNQGARCWAGGRWSPWTSSWPRCLNTRIE
jgi:hypothetical protein